MVGLREAKIPRGVRENIKDIKDLKSNNFFKLPETVQVDILNDGIAKFRTYIETRKLTPELSDYMKLFEDIYRETGDPTVTPYLQLFDAMKSRNGSKLSRDVFETLRNDDPDTFAVYSRYPGEEVANIPGFNFHEYKRTGNGVIESAEPTTGVLTSNPINNTSSAEAAPGALTNPSAKIPEVSEQPMPSRVRVRDDEGNIVEFEVGPKRLSYQSFDDAELNEILAKGSKETEVSAYTGNEPPIAGYGTPITSPGVHVSFNEKPVNLSPEEVTKFKPSSASPSPELPKKVTVISNKPISDEEMLKLTYPKEGVVVGPDTPIIPAGEKSAASPEAAAAEAAKGTTEKSEVKATSETPETPKEGALTGKDKKPEEPSKGVFSKIGSHIGRNWGKYGLGIAGLSWVINDLASDDSTLKSWFTRDKLKLNANNSSGSQPRVKSLDQREGAYMPERLLRFTTNEEYTPGKIPSHIPQDNLPPIKKSTVSKKVKSQPQVVNAPAPVNNATADYVRAAYNSYIPSDAGRAYQKAIYGDPLELDRMRLQQQQQQKWRDFVMRSGQSPAELVQRGLMPYDALQYI